MMVKALRYIGPVLMALLCGCSHGWEESDADRIRVTAIERLQQGKTYLLMEGITEAIDYYKEANDTFPLLAMYQIAEIKMRWKGEQDSAAMYLEKALEVATDQTVPTVTELYLKLANLYSHPLLKKDYRKAIGYASEAYRHDTSGKKSPVILHDIGIYYAFLGETDSATTYLEKALVLTPAGSPHYDALALNYASHSAADFRKGMEYLDKIDSKSLGKLVTKGFLYLNHGHLDSAAVYLDKSQALYKSSPESFSINTYNSIRLLENCLSLPTTGKVYPGEGTEINDSINARIALDKMIEAEIGEQNSALELQLLTSKTRAQRIWIVALALLLAGGTVTVWIFWAGKRRYIRLRKELDLLRENQIMIESQEEESEEDTFEIIKKRAEMCREQFRLTGLAELIQKGESGYNESETYLPIKERALLRGALLECFADFIVDLRMDAGKLTMDDIITALLALMRAQNSAIAGCLGVSAGAVRSRKTRLKSKLSPMMAQLVFG